MPKVAATEMQKNFGEWHDRVYEGPVEITKYNRTTSFLVSAGMFRDMMASYRKAVPAFEISDDLMSLIRAAKVETEASYTLDDIPEVEPNPSMGR